MIDIYLYVMKRVNNEKQFFKFISYGREKN